MQDNSMNELTTPTSGNLTAAQQDAYRLDYEIKAEAKNIVSGICRIGKCLKEMNERNLYKELGYTDSSTGEKVFFTSLEEYAERTVVLKGRAAYNYISAYEKFGEQGLEKYGTLGITKLSALAQLTDTDREELLESGKAEEMSTRELQEEIKRLKRQNDQLTFELEEKISSTSSNAEEFTAMQNSLGALSDEYKELQARAREERAALEIEIKELSAKLEEEKKNKVLPAPQISEAEKEEIRRNIEVEQEMRHNEEMKEAVEEASEKVKAEYEGKLNKAMNDSAAASLKLSTAEAVAKTNEKKIKELNKKLEQAQAENAKLQANAQKAPPSGNKELLKFLMKNIVDDFNKAAELVKGFPAEEQESCKQGLKKVAQAIKTAGDNL
ncbi:MAG: hypothetical protein IJZ65_07375 [Ruminiclostridium sp.]|nr:hypothetical protein [Ruminiclostridium sp.]